MRIVFLRVLWLHIRAYWFRTPGKTFMIFSFCLGILLPVILLAVTIAISGFSYRTSGRMCIINHEYSFAVFWAWTIGFAISSFLLQAFTSGYCLTVFLKSYHKMDSFKMSSDSAEEGMRKRGKRTIIWGILNFGRRGSVHLETDALSTSAARQRWNQMKSVILSQWRSFALCVALVVQCIPFVAHFVKSKTYDKTQKLTECLLKYGFDDKRCIDQKLILSSAQTTIRTGLIIAAVSLTVSRVFPHDYTDIFSSPVLSAFSSQLALLLSLLGTTFSRIQ
jgi:hypothetical protein